MVHMVDSFFNLLGAKFVKINFSRRCLACFHYFWLGSSRKLITSISLSLPLSFFISIKGSVSFYKTPQIHKKSHLGMLNLFVHDVFSKNNHIAFKFYSPFESH